ncbi:cytochrome P450 [Coprinellus micaceus]|uniref:Cytochrome P450 n=1 Tax=Coprinellus micaceus TaxID=71717 RepID=A0A4Y7TG05_COPMI|nr:cytochrome P450 [Coprinellus micaceus]
MSDFTLNGSAVGALALSCAYLLVHTVGETRKLAHIPSVGFNGPLLSYISALQLLWDPPGYLRRAWRTIPPSTHFVKVPGFSRWVVVGTRPEHYKEIAGAPDHQITLRMAVEEFLQARYTMFDSEIGDNGHVAPIREKLNRSLSDLVPEVYDEAKFVFHDEFPLVDERPFVAFPTIVKIIARTSNRILVGLPLCRNPEYIDTCINYAVVVFVMSHILCFIPPFLRSFVNWLVSPVPSRVKKMTGFLQPLIDTRRKAVEDEGEGYEQPASWRKSTGKGDRDIVLRTMSVNFGSIHTTSLSFTHGLFSLLSQPQHIDTIREEVEQCIQDEGWTRAANGQHAVLGQLLEGNAEIRSAGRPHPSLKVQLVSGQRMVMVDCTLSGVFLPKGTMLGTNAIEAQFDEDVFGENALEFDPYRFKIQLPTSTLHTLTFGYGKHACPGRFFAAQEMKLLVAYFLIHYDLKLENPDGKRPKNLWLNAFNMPSSNARVLMRKRKGVAL